MDGFSFELPIFLVATFAGALVAGLSGFAFGLVAASIWLYILTPLQTATLIIAFGLIVQGYSVWKLRRALDWKRLWPFVTGAALGVPIGVSILTWANPANLRAGVGAFLVLYSLYVFGPGESWRYPDTRVGGSAMADILHGSARTTPRVRSELQASKETTGSLARRYGLSRATVAKWRSRTTTADAPMGPRWTPASDSSTA